MKNIIVQIFINKKDWEEEDRLNWQNDEVFELSQILVKYYASQIGAEYYLITKSKINFKHPTWERFQLFSEEWVNKYSNILYLDTDVFTWPWAPNIFEFIKNDSFNVAKHCNNAIFNGQPGFNTGVYCFNKEVSSKLSKYISREKWMNRFASDPLWEDGKELNTITRYPDIKVNWMSKKWNAKNDERGYFTHLWGGFKNKYPNMPCIVLARKICKLIKNNKLKKS